MWFVGPGGVGTFWVDEEMRGEGGLEEIVDVENGGGGEDGGGEGEEEEEEEGSCGREIHVCHFDQVEQIGE